MIDQQRRDANEAEPFKRLSENILFECWPNSVNNLVRNYDPKGPEKCICQSDSKRLSVNR